MQTKDYLTLLVSALSLLVALASFLRAQRADRKSDDAINKTAVVNAAERKNEIVTAYQGVLHLLSDYRFYTERLARRVSELKAAGKVGGSLIETLMANSLKDLKEREIAIKEDIEKIKAFDPKEIATQANARETLEDLYGRSQQMTIQLTQGIEMLKRSEDEFKEKSGIKD